MATKRLYYDLVKSFTVDNITSIFGELSLLESLGFTINDTEKFKDKLFAARHQSSGKTFISETKDFSEKAIRNLLNSCGTLVLKNSKITVSILPLIPIGAYILRKIYSETTENILYTNPFKMFEDIRSIEGFDFDINLIQKHITCAVSENAVIDFAACRKEFESAKSDDENAFSFEIGVRFISANEVLDKEIEIVAIDGNHKVEFFTLDYSGHIDFYSACILVKNTPENLPIIQKLIKKFGWQHVTHQWFTEPLEEVLEKFNF